MYVRAYGRPPVESELAEIEAFLADQARARGVADSNDPGIWTDLAHAVFNTAEFLFVR